MFFNKTEQKIEDGKINKMDLGFIDDALGLCIELSHLEIHCSNSYFMTKDKMWVKLSNEARIDRSEILDLITNKDVQGQNWCFGKHDLRSIGYFIELSNRRNSVGDIEGTIHYLDKASKWLQNFMFVNKYIEEVK